MRRLLLALLLLVTCLVLGLFVHREPPPAFDVTVVDAVQDAFSGDAHAALETTTKALYRPWNFLIGIVLSLIAWLVRGWRAGLVVLVSMIVVLLAVEILKPGFGRLRPEASAAQGASRSARSYVSGHVGWTAATLGAFAVAMTRRRGLRLVALLAAGLATAWVATSRIHLGRHYVTDVVGAALLGAAVVILVERLVRPPARREVAGPD